VRPDLPPGRYDPPRRRDRVIAGIVGGVLGVAALLAGWTVYSRHQAAKLDAELTAYQVRSDSVVRISFDVVPRGHRGECKVRARDRSGSEAGSQIVTITPSGRRTQSVTVDLATTTRAVSGELVGCRRL
jgi:Domain of unknown function (DUF4307)